MTTKTLTIPFRSAKHRDLVSEATKAVPSRAMELGAVGEHEALLVSSDHEAFLAAIAEAIPKLDRVYDSRLMTATYVMARQQAPELPPMRSGRIARVVTGLNEARVDWSVRFRLDGTLDWFVGTSTEPVPLAKLVEHYAAGTGYAAKAKAKAKKATAPEAPAAVEPEPAPEPEAKKPRVRKAPAAKVEQARALAAKKAGRPAPKPKTDVTPIPKARKPRAARKAS